MDENKNESAGGDSYGASEAPPAGNMPARDAQTFHHGPVRVIRPLTLTKADLDAAAPPASPAEPQTAGQPAGSDTVPPAAPQTPQAVQDFINAGQLGSAGETAPAPVAPAEPAMLAQPQFSPPEQISPPSNPAGGGVHSDTGQPLLYSEPPKRARRWLKPVLAALVVLAIIAGVYVFAFFLPNTPGNVYSSSMKRTGLALDKLINYGENQHPTNYNSLAVNGNVNVDGKDYNFNGNLKGNYDKNGNTTTHFSMDDKVQGNTNQHIQLGLDFLTIKPGGQQSPDVYFKITGIDSLFGALATGGLDQYDGKWIVIDHNTIEQYAKQAADQGGSDSSIKLPTQAQINDAINQVQAVNKQYIFTANKQRAVLVEKKFEGAEIKYGRSTYHYQMGYNKANLLNYVKAVGKALDASQLNTWSKATYHKNLSEEMNFQAKENYVKKHAIDDFTFDMWADRHTKLVEAVRFTDPNNIDDSVTFGQMYAGGANYPFRVDFTANDSGDKASGTLKFNYNSQQKKLALDFNTTDDSSGDKTTASGHIDLTPSQQDVKPVAPSGAVPLSDVLAQLGFTDGLSSTDAPQSSAAQSQAQGGAESTISEAQLKLGEYNADNGDYPASQAAFGMWLQSPDGGNNGQLASQFTTANGYTYQALPAGCDNQATTCTDYAFTFKDSSGRTQTITSASEFNG